ncbi:hypothetical protein D9756_000073 [Leucocoprinus leucothites]|uniref:XRRM domain-containing protein n=1 Tax=Leucocoprinus leucothites TaxID=201217 RepID=A0A8H5GEA9_9AGAR|nr:hypothetical protein D9756_000073 [Leucoagaricus leucothites]
MKVTASLAQKPRMSSLSFVPRKLTKSTNAQKPRPCNTAAGASAPSASAITSTSTSAVTSIGPTATDEAPAKYEDLDYANLIALSLSDFNLWLNSDLRQKIGYGSTQGPEAGYISLSYLFEHSIPLMSLLDSKPGKESNATRSKVQAALVKGIRSSANHLFDVRLLLHPDETVPRFGKQKEVGGGYEIRRKRIGLVLRSKSEWDSCTLYIENIPPGYKSYTEIIRFLNDLLHNSPPIPSSSASTADPLTRIQGISFPPHHNDKPDARPSCKGFALVTFAHAVDCEHLEKNWPWLRETTITSEVGQSKSEGPKEIDLATRTSHVARQYDFRVITKKRWLESKAEYLAYRQKLVEEMNAYQDAQQKRPRTTLPSKTHDVMSTDLSSQPSTSASAPLPDAYATTSLNYSSPYPLGCLVFVKNVHPETTKTTLRSLLSQGLRLQDTHELQKNCEGLDYVDFSKGVDTCYLRLATPGYTAALVDYFDHRAHKIVQISGMDETGTNVSSSASSSSTRDLRPIVVERVTGRPEEIYWEKVPVKVKRAAVEKAIRLMETGNRPAADGTSEQLKRSLEVDAEGAEPSSKRKKRKL